MAVNQNPFIGTWYIDGDGRFLRVWGTVYQGEELRQVVLQQPRGTIRVVGIECWNNLDLVNCPVVLEPRHIGFHF